MTQTETLESLGRKLKEKITELHTLHLHGKATLAQALMIYPEELEEAYAFGLQLIAVKKAKEAAKVMSSLCLMEPYEGRFWRMAGLAFSQVQRPALALLAFEMALALLPDDLPTLTYRGETFILLGRRQEAKRDLQTVLAKGNTTSNDDAAFVKRAQGLIRYASASN